MTDKTEKLNYKKAAISKLARGIAKDSAEIISNTPTGKAEGVLTDTGKRYLST